MVQGPVPRTGPAAGWASAVLASVRRVLPGAQLVLSTDEGTDVDSLDADVIVHTPDPGPVEEPSGAPRIANVDRQVATTRAGLAVADRPFAVKLRSDTLLEHAGFLDHLGRWPARDPAFELPGERVLACTVYSRNPRRLYPQWTFHPSDWFSAGRLEDVRTLWDVPPYDPSELLSRHGRLLAPEQHVWLNLLRRRGIDVDDLDAPGALELSERSLAAGLVLLEPAQLGIRFLKYGVSANDRVSLYTHGEWRQLYQRWCEGRPHPAPDLTGAARTARAAMWQGLGPRLQARLRPEPPPWVRARPIGRHIQAVVLNYGNAGYTSSCVEALRAQDDELLDITVVDNGSSAEDLAELRARLPAGVEVLALEANRGVPGGLCPGLRRSLGRGSWATLIALNDTALQPGSLAALRRRLEAEVDLGVVAPLQVRWDDPSTVVTAGGRLWRFPWLVSRIAAGEPVGEVRSRPLPEPDYVDLTCLLVRNDALAAVGPPRVEYRFYWEDTDWGVRLRRAGWRLAVEPEAIVHHRVGGTLGSNRGGAAGYYQQRNRLLAKLRLDGPLAAAGLVAREPVLLLGRALVRGADGDGTAAQARALRDFVLRRPYVEL